MTAFIKRPDGKHSSGHNLDVLLRYAKTAGGVDRITVYTLQDDGRPGAYVVISYRNGAVGSTYFVFGSHAVEWAHSKAKKNKVSWFSECDVVVNNVRKGGWDYSQNKEI